MRRLVLLSIVLVTACIDLAGPRPRPGGAEETPTTETSRVLYWEMQPRVISQGITDSVRLTVAIEGTPDQVFVEPRNGTVVNLTRTSANLFSARIPASTLLFGYRSGDFRNAVGWIKTVTGNSSTEDVLLVNVKDATMPTVTPVSVASGMQMAGHVVNMRFDSLYLGDRFPPSVMRAFYNAFPDVYPMAAVVEQVITPKPGFLTLSRNTIKGLGIQIFDNGAAYNSPVVLEAIADFPDETQFDLAQSSNLRVLSNHWMNLSTIPSLQSGKPSWPLSTMANGMLGWADPQNGEKLQFPFNVTTNSNNTYSLSLSDVPRSFNDLELYLMGLLPPDSVRQHLVFLNQNQRNQVRPGGVLLGPVDTITASRWIALQGVRQPAYPNAPRQFPIVTIVLSRNGLLSRDELSFFDHMAARGERQEGQSYFNGALRSITLPFYVATGGRGSLITTLLPR
jgi:hypothetical protein